MASLPASILPNETDLYQTCWVVAPSVGKHRTEFTLAILNMSMPINCNGGVYMPMNTSDPTKNVGMWVDEARNIFAQAAIDNKVKYLMFVDEDVLVLPHTLRRLIYWMETFDDLDVVGGVYCAKDPADPDSKPYPLVFRGDGRGAFWDWRYGEFFEVSGMGMGATMLRVASLAQMPGPWFLTQRYTENIRNEAGEITGKHHFIGTEDLYFYRRLKAELPEKLGRQANIYCDGSLVFEHIDPDGRRYCLPPDCKILRPVTHNGKPFQNQGKVVLNLGSGPTYDIFEEGEAIRVDLDERVNPDYRADIRNLPFEDEFADLVFSANTLETFGRWQAEEVLKEWIRVLKPGGQLRLVVANLEWAAKQVAEKGLIGNPEAPTVLDTLYGSQKNKNNFTKFGFTPDLLKSLVESYGCQTPVFSHAGKLLVMNAFKKGTHRDSVQETMARKIQTWIRSEGHPVGDPTDKSKPEAKTVTVDEVIKGWTMDMVPKAFSALWDPNREAEVALALLTRRIKEKADAPGQAGADAPRTAGAGLGT